MSAASSDPEQLLRAQERRQKRIATELAVLHEQNSSKQPDVDHDMFIAYSSMNRPDLFPLEFETIGAWSWYQQAMIEPQRFLELFARRHDAREKRGQSANNQRMEDDKRRQFDMLDRLERQLTINVNQMVDDLMNKFPGDVLSRCFEHHRGAWDAFIRDKTAT